MVKIIIVLSAVLAVGCCFDNRNYCNINTCSGKPNTGCIFQSTKQAFRCRNVQSVGLTQNEKIRILNLHNELRMKVANGQERRGAYGRPQPRATNMQYLEWDNELAEIAQKWASQCDFNHDSCRDVPRFQVGQNIAYRGTTGNVNTINVEDIVLDWFNEVQDYSGNDIHEFRSGTAYNGKQIGHYTQLVWAETNKLGCGAIKYTEGRFHRFYLVCNYGPAGNFIGMPVYKTYGEPQNMNIKHGLTRFWF